MLKLKPTLMIPLAGMGVPVLMMGVCWILSARAESAQYTVNPRLDIRGPAGDVGGLATSPPGYAIGAGTQPAVFGQVRVQLDPTTTVTPSATTTTSRETDHPVTYKCWVPDGGVSYRATPNGTWNVSTDATVTVSPAPASQPVSTNCFTLSGAFPTPGYYQIALAGSISGTNSCSSTYSGTATGQAFLVATGSGVVKLPLGSTLPANGPTLFKVWVPTASGGVLTVTGSGPSNLRDPTGRPFQSGSETQKSGFGWYTFGSATSGAYNVSCTFQQVGAAKKTPWNFYWWSKGATQPTLYSDTGDYTPFKKYDVLFQTGAQGWEAERDCSTLPWAGHCLGGAVGSALLAEPSPTTMAQNGGLQKVELEGLWQEEGEHQGRPDDFRAALGGSCPASGPTADPWCGSFHKVLEDALRGRGVALVSNLRVPRRANNPSPLAVWNHAVYLYSAQFAEAPGGNERVVQITNSMAANRDRRPPVPPIGQDSRFVQYTYIIEYLPNGTINTAWNATQRWVSVKGDAVFCPENLNEITDWNWSGSENPGIIQKNIRLLDASNP